MDNSDEAAKALAVARRYFESRDLIGAERLCLKSSNISPSPAASSLLSQIRKAASQPQASTSSASASTSAEGLRSRTAPSKPEPSRSNSNVEREYTPDQLGHVKRIKACSATAYYEILGIKDTKCSDSDIKKAYRKHSLQVHPDKNGAPGSEAAFKLVSTAFQVLSDPDKRAHFDRYGSSPDDRRAATSGFARQSSGGGFQGGGGEMSPEDLFNMFFGGGGFQQGGFGGGFGGPGVRVHTFGQPRRQATNPQGGGQQQNTSIWLQLAPLFVLLFFSLLTNLPSLLVSPPPPDPLFSFDPYPSGSTKYTIHRKTQNHKIDYYLDETNLPSTKLWSDLLRANNPSSTTSESYLDQTLKSIGRIGETTDEFFQYKQDLASHPQFIVQTSSEKSTPSSPQLPKINLPKSLYEFEHRLESQYIHNLQIRCENETQSLLRRKQQAYGLMGIIGRDDARLKVLNKERLQNCERLNELGYRLQNRY